ncbi:MAG TPA: hypothetical protein VNT26_12560, partial [Candidatus Sulfotelmatobacter sp.]|nr:hypothetical protein [Candidatus Sulfotelmatobacter sp.]
MRRLLILVTLLGLLAMGSSAWAATGRVVKVLPQFLDKKGRNSLSPSLYDRDAYQATLRQHPDRRAGICFQVEYRAKGKVSAPLKVRLDLRGIAEGNLPRQLVLEE